MLIAMNENPDGVEQVKLANNAGYLGEMGDPQYIFPVGSNPQAPPVSGGQSATDAATKWIDSITRGAATVIPLFKKQPKQVNPKGGGGGGFDQPEDNTMTYVAIGGGVLIGGILLYSLLKKKKK